jgi:hypothetical protein
MPMIISDLNVMESIEDAAVIGGTSKWDNKEYTKEYDNYFKSRVNLKGNFASASFEAVAVGPNTFTDGSAIARTTSNSSISSGTAIAATDNGYK